MPSDDVLILPGGRRLKLTKILNVRKSKTPSWLRGYEQVIITWENMQLETLDGGAAKALIDEYDL